jgi:putative DNA primase/helicase
MSTVANPAPPINPPARPQTRSTAATPVRNGPDDPHRLARVFLSDWARDAAGNLRLRYWRGEWWYWSDDRYDRLPESDLTARITQAIKRDFDRAAANANTGGNAKVLPVTRSLVGNVKQAVASITLIDAAIEQPAIVGTGETAQSFLSFTNGIVDLDQLVARADFPPKPTPHTPNWFSTVKFSYAYNPHATCPQWLGFLDTMLERDRERIDLLQEMFGYCLTFDTSRQKFFVLEGDGSNGKSVVLSVLTELVDRSNVSNVPLELFGERFQLASTIGKLVNIAAEADRLTRVAEGTLKQFTGGDRMNFDRKGIAPIETHPTARLVIATNNRPAFADRSEGLWRRMILIPFRVRIPDTAQDPHLAAKLRAELPGILMWAVQGLRRLKDRGAFTIPAICADAKADYREQSNPARTFLLDACVADEQGKVPCRRVFEFYVTWCRDNGFEPLNSSELGVEVRRAFPTAKRKRETHNGRPWVYHGIRPAEPWPAT